MQRKWALAAKLASALVIANALVSCGEPATPAPSQAARELRIAAAADLRFALDELAQAFEARCPSVEVKVSYGSSGNFFALIQSGAPFDLFLSADIDYPRKLVDSGLGGETNIFVYGIGRLVVWVPAESKLEVEKLGLKLLLDPSIRKIAIANPRHAPYGRAAEAAMKSQNVYDQAQSKLVFGENVGQTLQFVQSGAADVGVIALPLAVAPQLSGQGRYQEIPLDSYPKLEQGGLILRTARDLETARAFRDWMLGASGRAVLKRHGFFLPEK